MEEGAATTLYAVSNTASSGACPTLFETAKIEATAMAYAKLSP